MSGYRGTKDIPRRWVRAVALQESVCLIRNGSGCQFLTVHGNICVHIHGVRRGIDTETDRDKEPSFYPLKICPDPMIFTAIGSSSMIECVSIVYKALGLISSTSKKQTNKSTQSP